jgi:hypothetical protein
MVEHPRRADSSALMSRRGRSRLWGIGEGGGPVELLHLPSRPRERKGIMVSSGRRIRRGAGAVALSLSIAAAGLAPGSPFVGTAKASTICWGYAHGGRWSSTQLWAKGEDSCQGWVGGLYHVLQLAHCDYAVGDWCWAWGPLATIGSRNTFGSGSWTLPPVASQYIVGNLSTGHMYHIRMAWTGTVEGVADMGEDYTGGFRL